MKNKWNKYALKDGKIKNSYIREYCNRKKIRKTGKASDCHSHEQSGQISEKTEVKNNLKIQEEEEKMNKQTAMDKKHESKGMKMHEKKEKSHEKREEKKEMKHKK